MQFGKSLVGAIIGAALGIGLLIVVYLQLGFDKMWMAIPVALLTGLGVRFAVAKSGAASYARGALTVVIALAAYLGGLQVSKSIATQRATRAPKATAHADTEQPAADDQAAANPESEPKASGPDATAPKQAASRPLPHPMDPATHRPNLPNQYPTWDLLALGIAALVAYELGRGSGGIAGSTTTVPNEPVPAGTHPDA
jgi:ABC-type antimicrobial peptide transport system permease subunit